MSEIDHNKEPIRDVPAFPENINSVIMLSTGRRLWAYRHGLLFFDVHDIAERRGEWVNELTHTECFEIADLAIRQWEDYREALHRKE